VYRYSARANIESFQASLAFLPCFIPFRPLGLFLLYILVILDAASPLRCPRHTGTLSNTSLHIIRSTSLETQNRIRWLGPFLHQASSTPNLTTTLPLSETLNQKRTRLFPSTSVALVSWTTTTLFGGRLIWIRGPPLIHRIRSPERWNEVFRCVLHPSQSVPTSDLAHSPASMFRKSTAVRLRKCRSPWRFSPPSSTFWRARHV
jgi:hypothetical protein